MLQKASGVKESKWISDFFFLYFNKEFTLSIY